MCMNINTKFHNIKIQIQFQAIVRTKLELKKLLVYPLV
uniref:Uncharacterized protein n=1 Tax=Podoviridae sp. ct8Lf7 TaxID=2827723 RepID=A0A8S5S0A5_9CAUD|nr:MAG TPA: hypothetical protein [Podoviridae sp. ct8Lf7]